MRGRSKPEKMKQSGDGGKELEWKSLTKMNGKERRRKNDGRRENEVDLKEAIVPAHIFVFNDLPVATIFGFLDNMAFKLRGTKHDPITSATPGIIIPLPKFK